MLVHCHAYGDASKAPGLVEEHSKRIHCEIDRREADEVGRLKAEYQPQADRLAALNNALQEAREKQRAAATKRDKAKAASALTKLRRQRDKIAAKVAERDERITEARRNAEDDRADVSAVGEELIALYAEPDELLKHARVVDLDEVKENEFNLNVPRYVDTFEPERTIHVADALQALREAQEQARDAETELIGLLRSSGYLQDLKC